MNWRKAAMVSAGVVALLVVAAALALHALVDPQRLKKSARDHAHSAWGRELLLGDVELSLFPVPSLRAARASLANPKWAKEPHLLQADSVRADLELLPLLTGRVRIKSLSLDGVKAALEVAEDGAVSWDLKRAAPAAAGESVAQGDGLQVSVVHIRNARILHRDHREASEPWLVEDARIEAASGRKDVRIEARLSRHERPLKVTARLADLSAVGAKGAASDGEVLFDWGETKLEAKGRLPLDKSLAGMDMTAALRAGSLHELFAFFGIKRSKTAPLDVRLKAIEKDGRVEVRDIAAKLGKLTVVGDARIITGARKAFHARLRADRIDWLETLVDAGGTLKPKRRDGGIFHADPVGWRAVTAVGAIDGTAELDVKSLKLGNGIELANVRSKAAFGNGRLELKPFAAQMLGGSATGAFAFDGNRKTVRVELEGDGLQLERWFRERGSKVPFRGGPMKVNANLSLAGATYRELAASVSGKVALRMGKGTWDSQRVAEAEEVMVRALHPKDGTALELQCAAADLEFKAGRASGKRLIGARSDVSQLLTSGHVDFRDETLDLRGKVYSRSGTRIGLGSFASDVQISGRLAKPTMQLDPSAAPAVLARAGAAIATSGASIIGSALADMVESKNNPCEDVFK